MLAAYCIFPFAHFLIMTFGSSDFNDQLVVDPVANCEKLDISIVAFIHILFLCFLFISPALFRLINRALFVVFFQAISVVLVGGWFVTVGVILLQCEFPHLFHKVFFTCLSICIVLSVLLFTFLRPSIKKYVYSNRRRYDFFEMVYRVKVKDHVNGFGGLQSLGVVATVISMPLVNYLAIFFGDMVQYGIISAYQKSIFNIIYMISLGLMIAFLLFLGELYIMLLILIETRKAGKSMRVS